jgi:hypothetical protein
MNDLKGLKFFSKIIKMLFSVFQLKRNESEFIIKNTIMMKIMKYRVLESFFDVIDEDSAI